MGDDIRNPIVSRLNDITNDEYLAAMIERSCYNATMDSAKNKNIVLLWPNIKLTTMYNSIVYRTCINLDPMSSVNIPHENNDWLLSGIISGDIDVDNVGYMTSDELNPHINQAQRDYVRVRGNQKVHEKTSTFYTCPECKQKKTTYRDVQLRSGDEGSTLRIYCVLCGHRWSQYG